MSKYLNSANYSFIFQSNDSYDDVEKKVDLFFQKFFDFNNIQKLLSEEGFKIYSENFLFIEHQEPDYICKTIDILERVFDVDHDSEIDNSYCVGFQLSRKIPKNNIKKIMQYIINPLLIDSDLSVSDKCVIYLSYKVNDFQYVEL
jgi:hypothetical protein